MTRTSRIFGHTILLKSVGCTHEGCVAEPVPPSVNIFVKVTNGCNAHCAFCSNAGAKPVNTFDIHKLEKIIREIKGQGIIVNRLNITGGEPACVPECVADILAMADKEAMRDIHLHLNTNGLLPTSQELMRHPRWDSVSVSLHHYDANKLSEIYGTKIPEQALLFDGIDMMKVNASCNLIKGYIDSTQEAHRIMDFCIDKGFTRLGFVGLMPVNDYCRQRLIRLDELNLAEIPHCYFTERRFRGDDCRCSNYLYNKNLKVLEIYMRHYVNPDYCESSLMYDGEYLRQGFHDNNIVY